LLGQEGGPCTHPSASNTAMVDAEDAAASTECLIMAMALL
jgi:hypothetical protein